MRALIEIGDKSEIRQSALKSEISENKLQPDRCRARGADRRAGEDAGEVDHVEAIGDIRDFDPEGRAPAIGPPQLHSPAEIDGEVRLDASALEVDLIEHRRTVLRFELLQIEVALELHRQPAAVSRRRARPGP